VAPSLKKSDYFISGLFGFGCKMITFNFPLFLSSLFVREGGGITLPLPPHWEL